MDDQANIFTKYLPSECPNCEGWGKVDCDECDCDGKECEYCDHDCQIECTICEGTGDI